MKEIHLICNAHIDPIWQWDWQEGVSATLSTFATAVRLADSFDYVFCHNEVTVYKYVEEYAPELFKKIKTLVKKRKWRIMGGWYLQPDCNMPTGESIVRQILKGKEYFSEKFGVFPETAINFDPFGHSRGIVQIIKKCGQNGYLFMRPYKHEMALSDEQFVWKGLDGSTIKATRCPAYNTPLGRGAEEIEKRVKESKNDVVCMLWGVGNHGGGPSAKDLKDIKERLIEKGDDVYIHSYPEKFFERVDPKNVVDADLRISMPGCYVSMGKIKRKHIALENELYLAEKMCSAAALSGLMEYPEKELSVACEDLLNAEFHDILPGTCIKSGEENGLNLLSHGMLEAERLKTRAFFALSKNQKSAEEGEFPIFVYNAKPYTFKGNIECEYMLADQNWSETDLSSMELYDENGNPVKFQMIKEESNINLDWRKRMIFEAEIKPFSMARYSLFVKFGERKTEKREPVFVFDNGRKHVEIDKNTGLLTSYRIDGKEYINGKFGLVSFDDNSDPWAMKEFQLGGFTEGEKSFETEKNPSGVFKGLKSVQVVEDGDVYLGIESFFKQDNTRARIGYKIYKNNDDVDIDVNLFLGDIDKIYKLKIPVEGDKVMGQTMFGTEELFGDGRENVSHRFIRIDGESERSFGVINDCTYGSSYMDGNLYISLVRGVTYCAHPILERQIIPTDRFVKKIDQGENDFSFRLTVAKKGSFDRLADEFNQKPYACNLFPIENSGLKQKDFKIEISDPDVTLCAFKKQDGADAYVLRLLNNSSEKTSAEIVFGSAKFFAEFNEYEVKTFVVKGGKITESEKIII